MATTTPASQSAIDKKKRRAERLAQEEAQIEATKKAQQEYEKTLKIQKQQMVDLILNAESDDSDSEI